MLRQVAALVQAGPRRPVSRFAASFRHQLRRRGWEVRRTDPDRSLAEHLWFLLPSLKVTCVLDVGAGAGEYGDFLRRNGYDGDIISFEPHSESFRRLTQRAAADPRWRVYPFTLGAAAGSALLNVTQNIRYTSLQRPTDHALRTFPSCAVVQTTPVEVRRLDDVLGELLDPLASPVLFLKVSPQGSELDVLRGAEQRLSSLAGLQIELSFDPIYEDAAPFPVALTTLAAAGFAVSGLFDRPHHHGFRVAEVDCALVRVSENESHVRRRW